MSFCAVTKVLQIPMTEKHAKYETIHFFDMADWLGKFLMGLLFKF